MYSFKSWCNDNGDFGKRVLADYIDSYNINNIGSTSKIKLKFRCSICHNEFERAPAHVTRMRGCPYCNPNNNCVGTISKNSNRRLINSNIEIASEYMKDKNDIDIDDILVTSNKSVWWKCNKCGQEWKAIVANRVNHCSGCPVCSKGNQGSFMEYALYLIINESFKDVEYQFKVNGMSFDIGIPNPAVVIEYQGRYYHNNVYNNYDVEKRDKEKREFVEAYKDIKFITVNETYGGEKISIRGNDIYFNADNNNKDESLRLIAHALEKILDTNIPVRNNIIEYTTQNLKLKDISDSLATKYKDIASEWNYNKNGSLKPTQIKPKSNKKVWWVCSKCGYEWQTSPAHRISDGTGCPKCLVLSGSGAGRHIVIEGINDLKSKYPFIASEWDSDKNKEIGLDLDNISTKSNKSVWWKCSRCGHSYKDKVVYRTTRNHGCPFCN